MSTTFAASLTAGLTAGLALLLTPPVFAQGKTNPAWLLVRSEAKAIGAFSWEHLAKSYLRANYRIVHAKDAAAVPTANRLVLGTPNDNALIKRLAKGLGVTFEGKAIRYQGKRYPDHSGIVLVTDDPDGKGRLAFCAGATSEGVFHCLTVPVDLNRVHYWVMTKQKVLAEGDPGGGRPMRIAPDAMPIVRLDLDLWRMRSAHSAASLDEAALRVSRAFTGYRFLFQSAVGKNIDLLAFTRDQFHRHAAELQSTRERFGKQNLTAMLREQGETVAKALGGWRGPRPIVYTLVTRAGATNAKVFGKDPQTGRTRMMLNLAAFDSLQSLRLAATHEFVHTLQSGVGRTLLERSVHEGVAVFLSQQLLAKTSDHAALMWTEAKLAAANERRGKILDAFFKLKDSKDPRKNGSLLYLGRPLRSVPGAPDRCGYYVGWLAVKAWRAKHPNRALADLLHIHPARLFAALKK